ncbi:hypothetical protein SASPL_139114 [Salvia splendens]|uniref:F-box and leucine-rich repeat protein 2/20 n=1 Tax=Salvia splendens TaxID=180675 RepID=A0A8X8ZF10_SALSN|nr:hypothetical protein SASPL_139114 [Salvia splendens]
MAQARKLFGLSPVQKRSSSPSSTTSIPPPPNPSPPSPNPSTPSNPATAKPSSSSTPTPSRRLRRYRRIRRLDFTNCPSADDGVISAAVEAYYATLRSVDLSRSRLFTHAALSLLAAKCGGLVELDLSNATELRDAAAAVAEARNLEKLWMGRCRLVSDIGIGCIAVGCKKLKLLSLKWCVRITDLGAGLLANKYTLLCALGPKSKSVSSRLKSQNDPLFWHIP